MGQHEEKKSITIQSDTATFKLLCVSTAASYPHPTLQLYTIFYFVKGHLGCCSVDGPVVWQSGDGNACWLACCHPDRGREGGREV